MIFDISSKSSSMRFLCEFLGLYEKDINDYFIQNKLDLATISGEELCYMAEKIYNDIGITINDRNVSEISLKVKHYTSNNDNCSSIEQNGILPLKRALIENTPLKNFLEYNGIYINIDTAQLKHKGQIYDISNAQSDVYDNKQKMIGYKIYFDGHINAFLRIDNITKYSAKVEKRPEFLETVDGLLKTNLSYEWMQRSLSYEVNFYAPVSEFQFFSYYDKPSLDFFDANFISVALIYKALGSFFLDWDEMNAHLKPEVVVKTNQIESIIPI